MRSPEDIEKVLKRLGSAWPDHASIVDRVTSEVNSSFRWDGGATATPTGSKTVIKSRRILVKSLLAIAASLVACAAMWFVWEGNHNTLYAQVVEAARKAQTIHIVHYGQHEGEAKPVKITENWYEKGVGFRRDACDWTHKDGQCATLCLSHGNDFWTLDKERKNTVVHSQRGITKETEEIFSDIDRHARDLQDHGRRYPEGDQTLDGQACKAYLLGSENKADLRVKTDEPEKHRQIFYLDEHNRLVRIESQERQDDHWKTTLFTTIAFDEPFKAALFQPNFGKDVKVVEAAPIPHRLNRRSPRVRSSSMRSSPVPNRSRRRPSIWIGYCEWSICGSTGERKNWPPCESWTTAASKSS